MGAFYVSLKFFFSLLAFHHALGKIETDTFSIQPNDFVFHLVSVLNILPSFRAFHFADETGAPIEKPMATLIYIHGESYEWNSGNLYDGTVLAAHSNIIVVTINFRLGVLGESYHFSHLNMFVCYD